MTFRKLKKYYVAQIFDKVKDLAQRDRKIGFREKEKYYFEKEKYYFSLRLDFLKAVFKFYNDKLLIGATSYRKIIVNIKWKGSEKNKVFIISSVHKI